MNTVTRKSLLLITACSSLLSASAFAATSNSVNIDITGTVIASPCVVNGDQPSLEVNIGDTIQADSLSAAGSASDWKDFTLALTSCPASTSSFSVTFSGSQDASDDTMYMNTGTATNLKLELTTQDGATTLGNNTSIDNVVIPAGHSYDLDLRTRAVSKGNVMPGTIVGQVQATFTYQ